MLEENSGRECQNHESGLLFLYLGYRKMPEFSHSRYDKKVKLQVNLCRNNATGRHTNFANFWNSSMIMNEKRRDWTKTDLFTQFLGFDMKSR